MELAGTGKGPVTSVEVFIVTERSARIRLHWHSFPFGDTEVIPVTSVTTYDELRERISETLDFIGKKVELLTYAYEA